MPHGVILTNPVLPLSLVRKIRASDGCAGLYGLLIRKEASTTRCGVKGKHPTYRMIARRESSPAALSFLASGGFRGGRQNGPVRSTPFIQGTFVARIPIFWGEQRQRCADEIQ